MKLIPLTKNQFAQVDDHWFDYLTQWKWHANYSRGRYYAQRSIPKTKEHKAEVIHMHRIIMSTPPELVVDHIDGNGLNNLEENMRNCTRKQNQGNRVSTYTGLSKYKGVSFNGKYIHAQICIDHKTTRLGTFKTEEEAAKAYDEKAKEYFGEFANLNFK